MRPGTRRRCRGSTPGCRCRRVQREVQVTSNTDLIGYGDKAPEVTQKYAIYDENNKLVEEKSERVAAVDGAGRYQTDSKFKLPASAKGTKLPSCSRWPIGRRPT